MADLPQEKRRKVEPWPSFPGLGCGEREGRGESGSVPLRAVAKVADATCPDAPAAGPIASGIAFLDHMVDQLNSHAQLRVSLQVWLGDACIEPHSNESRASGCDGQVVALAGAALGAAVKELLDGAHGQRRANGGSFRFCAPLDEAFTDLRLEFPQLGEKALGTEIDLAPYGCFPRGGRRQIGSFRTELTEVFLHAFAEALGASLKVRKVRGDNAHHIVEATFKSLARCLRSALDAFSGASEGAFAFASAAKPRRGGKQRSTKETSIDVSIDLDTAAEADANGLATGLRFLDVLIGRLRAAAGVGLRACCRGDTWIDDHHSTEDVMITVGKGLAEALGDKAGCTRMAWAEGAEGAAQVLCVMDLSNRPSFCSDLRLHAKDEEFVDDVSVEMIHHCFESFVMNGLMTVHLLQALQSQSAAGVQRPKQRRRPLERWRLPRRRPWEAR
ncbi:hisB [Symbiodinium natans]|uniref:imidazoleglycerol-phosphate dehydratase n=1 Tax=Symbiodinium natans TaxID=878477 RepID=A0A812V1D5_9DINO|nr:hisB [Symbiodinium natans]